MVGTVRKAQTSDVPAMVELSELKRIRYQEYQPTFWRKASDSYEKQLPFFEQQLKKENVLAFVYEVSGKVRGFIIGTLVSAPPVYNPGGLTCVIDDYCVESDSEWSIAGTELLAAATSLAKSKGAAQVVVVCGHLDKAKQSMLSGSAMTIASNWWVKDI